MAAGIRHFVCVSVAHPAPVMKEYIAARSQAEAALQASGLNATALRPWLTIETMAAAVACPPAGIRVLEVPQIRLSRVSAACETAPRPGS